MNSKIRIHKIIPSTFSNGPGERFGIWVQGCLIRCKGCINPETHDFKKGKLMNNRDILKKIQQRSSKIEGVTISGGEPFDQPRPLLNLIKMIKKFTNLGIILYSGYSYDELMERFHFNDFSNNIDLLISGRFDICKLKPRGLRGSENQTYHFFSDRYNIADIEKTYISELIIKNGEIIITGVDPGFFRKCLGES